MKEKMKKNKKWIIMGTVVIVLILMARGCAATPGGFGLERAEIRDISTFYSYSGVIVARNRQNVTAPGGNVSVERIHVSEGDFVRVGDLLISFEATDLESGVAAASAQVEIARINLESASGHGQAQSLAQGQASLAQAETSFRDAQANLDRMRELFASGAVSRQQLEQAETAFNNANTQLELARVNNDVASTGAGQQIRVARAQYDQARANLRSAQNALNNRIIRAEVAGIVADIYVQEGITLVMGEPVIDVVDYDDLILEIRVDEYEIAAMSEGKEVLVHVNALNRDVRGRISRIANQASRIGDLSFFATEVQLEESYGLRVGLSVELRVPNVERRGVVTISMDALQFDLQNNPFVLVGDRRNPERRSVSIGENDGVIVEITEGLAEGDEVLVPRSFGGGMMIRPGGGGGGRN